MISGKHLNWVIALFLGVVVAIVFQQISTSMMEQGIASGGPYDNGATYPRYVAIAIGVLVIAQLLIGVIWAKRDTAQDDETKLSDLKRPALLLLLFTIYVSVLTTLGYHLTTAPMIFGIMWICGAREKVKLVFTALIMSFAFAYIFEKVLNVVLPGGIFGLNIPW